jgi:hypothetical protein
MITDQIIPAYIIRLYLWQILLEAEALTLINGKIPVIPLEDEPELSDAGKSYIIYGYAENEATIVDEIRRGTFAARVIARNTNELDRIISIISRAFESPNIATEGLNRFSTAYANDALIGIRFTYAKTGHTEGFNASPAESGPVEGMLTITYRYINHLPTPVPEGISGGLWV